MNIFKAVLFIMCAVASSQAQYMQSGSRGWQNQGSPTGPAGGGASTSMGSASYGSGNRNQYQNEWMPIAGSSSSMSKGSYGMTQQTAQIPAMQPMSTPIVAPAPVQEEAPAAEVPATTVSASAVESCAAPASASTTATVHQICTCTTLPAAPEAPAASATAASSTAAETVAETVGAMEQPAYAGAEMTSSQQSAPVAQHGNSYFSESSTSSQTQTSFNSGMSY